MLPAPSATSGWVLGGTRGASAASDPAVPANATGDSAAPSGREAADAAQPLEAKPAAAAKPPAAQRPKPAEPVSRWTTVDDADDGSEEPIAARIAAAAVAEQSSDDEDLFKGASAPVDRPPLPPEADEDGEQPGEADADARSAGGATPPVERDADPDAVVKAARAAKDDEERRQRLRQVCNCDRATASQPVCQTRLASRSQYVAGCFLDQERGRYACCISSLRT